MWIGFGLLTNHQVTTNHRIGNGKRRLRQTRFTSHNSTAPLLQARQKASKSVLAIWIGTAEITEDE
jgi:hypothetical protein